MLEKLVGAMVNIIPILEKLLFGKDALEILIFMLWMTILMLELCKCQMELFIYLLLQKLDLNKQKLLYSIFKSCYNFIYSWVPIISPWTFNYFLNFLPPGRT